ncbi:A-kinase anchor protein inhibitor 1 [Python bivittatus]|uniref:A-kinase anchor protein inhibitor 1 n=1 Tax=Python bivittatus TaxID=176946 RepID=A0A9F5IYU4_PYTBI|nr:A-kinase anchor protein inhibitor 1 [Python bivittatus]
MNRCSTLEKGKGGNQFVCSSLWISSATSETLPAFHDIFQEAEAIAGRERTQEELCPALSWDKSGTGQEETKLQNASKLIVHTVIQQAVQQLSQESRQKEKGTESSLGLQLERGQLTKKHEKK